MLDLDLDLGRQLDLMLDLVLDLDLDLDLVLDLDEAAVAVEHAGVWSLGGATPQGPPGASRTRGGGRPAVEQGLPADRVLAGFWRLLAGIRIA